jgi:arylsulfatase A-like enzyme
MRFHALATVSGCAALALAACSGGGGHSVLLVTLDTLRADALGAYGRTPSVTPHLDELAGEGVVFEAAYTVAPLTLPAHASMLTGLFPPRHGVRDNGLAALPQSATTLAERAREARHQTAAFLGAVVLDQGFGLEQGFETYEAPARRFYGGASMGYAERPAHAVVARAIDWLRARDAERPFLLWVHLWDAHAPHQPTEDHLARAGGDPYLGEVAACDLALGRLFAALRAEDLMDSTLVVVVADHGEAFGEHGEVSHGPFVWNTTLRVPLILRLPGGKRAGTRVAGVASVVDVHPTALEALGLTPAKGVRIDGLSLLGRSPPAERGAYFESYYGHLNFGWHPLSGWVDGSGKLVHAPTPLYFEPSDAGEVQNLAPERPERVRALRGRLEEFARLPALPPDAEGLDPELKRSLQALGYAAFAKEGVSVPAPLATLELPDPHTRVAELARFQRAEGLLAAQRHGEAERELRALLDENPGNPFAWDRLALCLMRQDRHREALEALERVLALAAGNADTWNYVGACQLVAGAEDKALAAFTRALELDPNHVHALGGLVHVMEAAGLGERATPFRTRFEAVQARP